MNKKYITGIIIILVIVAGVAYSINKPISNKTNTKNSSPWLSAYYHGNYKEAAEILKPLAEAGNPIAMYNLATLYQTGLGVEKDYTKAINIYTKVADKGYPEAYNQLGNTYSFGLGVPVDNIKALSLYKKAILLAEKNDNIKAKSTAQYNLSFNYLKGLGVKKNYITGIKLLKESAEAGNISAQSNLSIVYIEGLYNIKKNPKTAIKYMLKAAESGDTISQCNLGIAYKTGNGITKDLYKAYMWFYVASHYNYNKAKINLKELNPRLNPEQKTSAISEAKTWINTHEEMNMKLTSMGPIHSVNKL